MSQFIIRQAEGKDATPISDLEKICFSQPWSYESIHHDIAENKLAIYMVAEVDDKVVGYAGIWGIIDEGHITNVAVLPEYRGQHVATLLLENILKIGQSSGLTRYTLEVRKSNFPAIELYSNFQFKIVGERKGYYEDDGEDALIMWRE